jgi:hypothetical protein
MQRIGRIVLVEHHLAANELASARNAKEKPDVILGDVLEEPPLLLDRRGQREADRTRCRDSRPRSLRPTQFALFLGPTPAPGVAYTPGAEVSTPAGSSITAQRVSAR